MYLSHFITQATKRRNDRVAAVPEVLITKPASMPALAKLGKILGKRCYRWG